MGFVGHSEWNPHLEGAWKGEVICLFCSGRPCANVVLSWSIVISERSRILPYASTRTVHDWFYSVLVILFGTHSKFEWDIFFFERQVRYWFFFLNTRCTRTRPVLQKLCQVFFSTSTSYYFEEILSEKNCESVKPLRHPRQTRHIFRNRQTENHCSIPYTTILLPYTRLRTKR